MSLKGKIVSFQKRYVRWTDNSPKLDLAASSIVLTRVDSATSGSNWQRNFTLGSSEEKKSLKGLT